MPGRTRIKMCGITRKKDAAAGIEAGVDALGFIFHEKSPRNIKPDFVRQLVSSLPPFVDSVGVFVDRQLEEVEELVEYCRLSHAQLHGSESPKYCERLERFASPVRIIKAFRIGEESQASDCSPYDDVACGYLLDTYVKGNAGGTGETFNWEIIKQLHLKRPLILAGGLSPENILNAMTAASPFAVDVNSGVESAPGIKDHAKITEFVKKVKSLQQI